MNLFEHSIDVILKNQDQSGAYIACPNFPTYHYCWLRDGSFVAYSMDRTGHSDSAAKFYRWVGQVIRRYTDKVTVLEEQIRSGVKPDTRGILNTRFTLEGIEEGAESGWGNFQIDGYGTWLWGLAEHVKLSGDRELLAELIEPIQTTLRYLKLVWQMPNYDCWEEHPEYLHPYSLATTYGGLAAVAEMQVQGLLPSIPFEARRLADEVKLFIDQHAVCDGRFSKHLLPAEKGRSVAPLAASGVDASLLGLTLPYGTYELDHPYIIETVQSIEKDLHYPQGGIYRYKEDVYYGGGEWILLSAWLGWYYALSGRQEKAGAFLHWIESVASQTGDLPEQVNEHPLAPQELPVWKKRWGPVASPLLWSHAMYLILYQTLKDSIS